MSGREPDLAAERLAEAWRWLVVAADDADVARLCTNAYEPKLGAGAYHIQQAVEKLMKGLLVLAMVPFPRTHDLRTLGRTTIRHYPDWSAPLSATFAWTVWGHGYRYPGPEDYAVPSLEELRQALATADQLTVRFRTLLTTQGGGPIADQQ